MNSLETNNNNHLTVLWLPSWYPGRTNQTNGDFIERQAAALAGFARVIVLFVEKDPSLKKGETTIEKSKVAGMPIIYKAYYGTSGKEWIAEGMYSLIQFRKLQKRVFRQIQEDEGQVQIVHVHIAFKAGLLALHLKKKNNIPFLVSEHWTGYNRQAIPNYYNLGWLQRQLIKRILRQSALLLPVSKNLGQVINREIVHVPYTIVPNVVNTKYFFYRPYTPQVFRFYHASYLNYQKNPEAMIRAASQLAAEGFKFELHLVGNQVDSLKDLAEQLGLMNSFVFIRPAISNAAVASEMQQASAFLLFSRFENLPCVVLEALCCGLPVVSSSVGGIPEVIDEKNGILVAAGNQRELVDGMRAMIRDYDRFNRAAIAAEARSKFSYEVVGEQILQLYRKVLMSR